MRFYARAVLLLILTTFLGFVVVAALEGADRPVVVNVPEGETVFLEIRAVGSQVIARHLPVAVVGSRPIPKPNPNPGPKPNPTSEIEKAAATLPEPPYPRRDEHRRELAGLFALFSAAAKPADGSKSKFEGVPPGDVNAALQAAQGAVLGGRAKTWRPWQIAVGEALEAQYGATPTTDQLGDGYAQVALGLDSAGPSGALEAQGVKRALRFLIAGLELAPNPPERLLRVLRLLVDILPAKGGER